MTWTGLVFDPHMPWPLIAGLGLIGLLPGLAALFRGLRGGLWRTGAGALLILALCDPSLIREDRQPLDDIVLFITDRSESQTLGSRAAQTDQAEAMVRAALEKIPHLNIQSETLHQAAAGTLLATRLKRRLDAVAPDRLAGAIVISDGAIADADAAAAPAGPVHFLLSGAPRETDRRLIVEHAASFALVGKTAEVTFRIDETPTGSTAAIPVTLHAGDGETTTLQAVPGRAQTVKLPIDRADLSTFEIRADARPGEITARNNQAVVEVNGVRDRLRVLLVSGQPHPGERAWRNLLKSDPAVDLVHFTILRPPGKGMFIPTRELSLIRFPVVELFEDKLDKFDLVIFDRYVVRHLLPQNYFANIADYVDNGGALLVAVGPEFAALEGLSDTPLARILPGWSTGEVLEQSFVPRLTAIGAKHPITADLPRPWGRMFRQVEIAANGEAHTLIDGIGSQPVLQLRQQGRGRVAQINTDQFWLWARGYDGGGPYGELIRRLAHWLMREPALEAEAVQARPGKAGQLTVHRRSLKESPDPVILRAPSRREQSLPLVPGPDGRAAIRIDTAEPGRYELIDGRRRVTVALGDPHAKEFEALAARADLVGPFAAAGGGAVVWLGDPVRVPAIRKVRAEGARHGGQGRSRWLGLRRNEAFAITGYRRYPLLAGLLAVSVILTILGVAWWREGH